MKIDQVRKKGGNFQLSDWSILSVRGRDRESFLNGQLTNDLKKLKVQSGQWTTRIDLAGHLKFYFNIIKLENEYYLLIKKKLKNEFIEDISKFIIMEDVEIIDINQELNVFIGPGYKVFAKDLNENFGFSSMYGEGATYYWGAPVGTVSDIGDIKSLQILSGQSSWDNDLAGDLLLNNSTLNEVAVSYAKGCFYGQEVVAKVQNNRGPAYYPVLLEILTDKIFLENSFNSKYKIAGQKMGEIYTQVSYAGKNYFGGTLFRDNRINGKKLTIEIENDQDINVQVRYFPFFSDSTPILKSEYLFHEAVKEFHKENLEEALSLLELSISIYPLNKDSYETLGVILGRLGRFQEGIAMMDELLKVDSSSVMAHTNKSLFLMNLGKIEEAENEKSLATVKSFAMHGKEANEKKMQEKLKIEKAKENSTRQAMFLQVLEIDGNDSIANFGMADILFSELNFVEAEKYIVKAIANDKKYSVAYLLCGKIYQSLNKIEQAKRIYQHGIEVASKSGDMMPANAMQENLSKLEAHC